MLVSVGEKPANGDDISSEVTLQSGYVYVKLRRFSGEREYIKRVRDWV
ncbi:MAG: hypothetical protein OEM38_12575 [Gammaproteobacteria bacterium]|nr:hypothetical protein [Gammaproteobacteria bacterium]